MSSSDLSSTPSPETGSLARLFEDCKVFRERVRDKGYLTRWPSAMTVGVPSVKAMGLNTKLLETLASWWCPLHEAPTAIPITVCRKEASCLNFVSRGFVVVSTWYIHDNCIFFVRHGLILGAVVQERHGHAG